MSDCGVCVYSEHEPADVFEQFEVKARRNYACSECRRPLPAGTIHQVTKMHCDGEWSTWRTCLVCAEIRKAFSCEGECVAGCFWEDFEQNFTELNESCFEKLQTVEAKKYLRERWMKWKGLPV